MIVKKIETIPLEAKKIEPYKFPKFNFNKLPHFGKFEEVIDVQAANKEANEADDADDATEAVNDEATAVEENEATLAANDEATLTAIGEAPEAIIDDAMEAADEVDEEELPSLL